MSRHVPFIPQMEAVECGAASLAMVLGAYGHHAPLAELRQACGISRDGSTAKNIVVAARAYNLVPRARRVEPEDLIDADGPAILHWEMNHFVVLERLHEDRAIVLDPAVGRRIVSREAFDESFTGIAISFTVAEDFEERKKERVSVGRYLSLLSGAARALVMVLLASLVLNVLATVVALTTSVVIDRVLSQHRISWLVYAGGSALFLVTFAALWSLLRGALILRVRARLDVSITERFVAHLLDLPVPFFAQRSVADLMSRVQAQRTIRDLLAGQSIGLLADGVMLIAYFALMFAFDPRLSLVVLVAALGYVALFFLARPALRAGADDVQRKQVASNSALLSVLRGIATIKSAGVERSSRGRFLNAFIASLNVSGNMAIRQERVANLLSFIQTLVPIIVLYLGGRRVIDGDLTPGRLVGFQMLQIGFLLPLTSVIESLIRLQVVPVLLGRMDDVLLTEREPERAKRCPRLDGEIELRNVSFRHGPTSPNVLSDVSIRIAKGKKVALVGPSGSGKSTLARLLLGLYEPTEGEIFVDGHDLAELDPPSVRRQYGVVLQETALFDGTVSDNLRLFYPNAPLEHVVQAARVAQIHEDILALPQGYETRLSSNGGALSGGQRQRLALARAIVHRPAIMILDEATSALDAVTEAAIERYLTTRACTRVVIAHRLSTVRDADTIFVLDAGRVVEQGTHDELAVSGGLYERLLAGESAAPEEDAAPESVRHRAVVADDLSPFAALARLSPDARAELCENLKYADFSEGTRVVERDAPAAGLYLIVGGKVAVELAEPGLAAWTVAELGPGALFGEIGLLDGSPASASAVARTDVRALHLPYARFQEVLRSGDVLGAELALALGAIVAERTRDAVVRHAALLVKSTKSTKSAKGTKSAATDREKASAEKRARSGVALPLAATLLGASLAEGELRDLERKGERVEVRAGAALFLEGTSADTLFVILLGHVALSRADTGVLRTLGPGAIAGEASAFDPSEQAVSAIAVDDVVAFAITRDALTELLISGQPAASKLLSAITSALVLRFRLANYRLREAVARDKGELEDAHRAHEEALEASREEREALLATKKGKLPIILTQDEDRSMAACVTAFLRATGRPVALASVLEAFEAGGGAGVRGLAIATRSLGLDVRELGVGLDDLRATTAPILAVLEGHHAVILERYAFGRWKVMDPLKGRITIRHAELLKRYANVGFEVREESSQALMAPLSRRLASFARSHSADISRVIGTALLLQAFATAASLATALVVARVFPTEDGALLSVIVAATAALAIAFAITSQLSARAVAYLRVHFDRELTDELMNHVLRLPIAFFDRLPTGEVLQRFQAFDSMRTLFSTDGVSALLTLTSLVTGTILLFAFAPHLVIIPALVLLLYALVTLPLFRVVRRAAADEVRARGVQQDSLIEVLQGIVTLRMAGDRSRARERWLPTFLAELAAGLRQESVRTFAFPILEWARGIGLVLSLWLGARDVVAHSLSLGELVAFLAVLANVLASVHVLAVQALGAAPALVDYGLARATFEEKHEQTSPVLLSPGQLKGRIAVDEVSFRYTEDGPYVLRDVSLDIAPGMKVALVGASGSGKSTLGRLLLGLYLPTSGRILFDGKDVTSLDLPAMRARMGVVLQEPFLLGGSIRENISLGAEGATLEEVVDAAKRASIHDDIEKMGMGYNTLVAEGGATFSGGQRQRIVIARALVSHPAVMLLDEATSALDNFSQGAVEANMRNMSATRIVIAHRLSTIVDADLIVVMHKGKIVERGTHDELLEKRGAYFELVRAEL